MHGVPEQALERHVRVRTADLFGTTLVWKGEPATNVGRIFDNTHPCVPR
jgi:hypothetical protein